MSLSVITSAATTVPASVSSVLAVLSFFGLVPRGKAERLTGMEVLTEIPVHKITSFVASAISRAILLSKRLSQ